MKCDLAEVWKLALSNAEWTAKEQAKKNAIAEADRRHAAEKEELSKQGWEFLVGSFTHPHNTDTWLETTFKSPRMLHHRSYYGTDVDFHKEEAKSIAFSHTPRFVPIIRELIESHLADYFYENPTATTPPKISIQIDDNQGK